MIITAVCEAGWGTRKDSSAGHEHGLRFLEDAKDPWGTLPDFRETCSNPGGYGDQGRKKESFIGTSESSVSLPTKKGSASTTASMVSGSECHGGRKHPLGPTLGLQVVKPGKTKLAAFTS